MTTDQLTYDLADKVLDGVFEPPTNAPLEIAIGTYTLDGRPLSALSAAFRYETDIRERGLTDRATALTEFGGKIRLSPSCVKRWMASDDYSKWAELRKMPRFSFSAKAPGAAPIRRDHRKLTKDEARKGGQQRKVNRGLQNAIRRIAEDLRNGGRSLTLGNLRTWLTEQTQRGRDETMRPEAYSFDPPIPDCDELYIDGRKLVWKKRDGSDGSISLRSLEPYLSRAKQSLDEGRAIP